MKWMVAGAGALLSLAGAYALVTGSSIVQVERGWSMVIAGAVILAAGAVLLGMAAVMAKMEQLARAYLGASAPAFARPVAPHATEEPAIADEPQVRRRFPRAPVAPDTEARDMPPPPAAVDVEPPPPSPASFAPAEPAASPGLPDFEFVFPVPEPASEPAPAPKPPEAPSRVEPLRPPRPAPSPAASRFANQWLRRNRPAPVAPAPVEPSAASEPEAESEPAPEPRQHEAESFVPAEPPAAFVTAESNVLELRVEAPAPVTPAAQTPSVESEPASAPVEPAADPFSPDWLERAIAAGEAQAEASQENEAALEDKVVADEGEALAAEPVSAAPEPAAASSDEAVEAVERTPTPAPVEIGRYKANDVAYVMYADGSITAETPAGATYRFGSLLELRKFIEKGGA